MNNKPLASPLVIGDPTLHTLIKEIGTSEIGRHLLEFSESNDVTFAREDLGAGSFGGFSPKSPNGKAGAVVLSEGATAKNAIYVMERLRQTYESEAAYENMTAAPLAFVFTLMAMDAIAETVSDLHDFDRAHHALTKSKVVRIDDGKIAPIGMPKSFVEFEQDVLKQHGLKGGSLKKEMRLESCAHSFVRSMGANKGVRRQAMDVIRMANNFKRDTDRAIQPGIYVAGASVGLSIALYLPIAPLALLSVLPAIWDKLMLGLEVSKIGVEDETVSLRKAYAQVYKLAELPYGWGNYMQDPREAKTEDIKDLARHPLSDSERRFLGLMEKKLNSYMLLRVFQSVSPVADMSVSGFKRVIAPFKGPKQ